MQWLQNQCQNNTANLGSPRHKTNRQFRDKIGERETNSKNSNITELYDGIHGYKGYQPRNKLLKAKKCDLTAVYHTAWNKLTSNGMYMRLPMSDFQQKH